MTTQDMEQLISEVNGTLAIEGMPLDETDRDNLRSILRGEVSYQEMKQRILKEYHRKLRDVNISKGNPFCQSAYIVHYAMELFEKLTHENFLQETLAGNAANLLSYSHSSET